MTTSFIVSSLIYELSLSLSLSFFPIFHTHMHCQQLRRTLFTGTHLLVINIIYTGWLWLRALKFSPRSFMNTTAVVTCTSLRLCLVLAASYKTTINAIHNNRKQIVSRTWIWIPTSRIWITMISSTPQSTAVKKGQVGLNCPNFTKTDTAWLGSPCISRSNAFINIFKITMNIFVSSIPNGPSTTAQKRKMKQSKTSCVSTVQTNASMQYDDASTLGV